MAKLFLHLIRNFSVAGMPQSRRFRMGLGLTVAVIFLFCLLALALSGIRRIDSQNCVAAMGNDLTSRQQSTADNAEIESGEGISLSGKLTSKYKEFIQNASLIHLFKKGGPIMWPLLFASILALGTVVERVVFLVGEERKRDPQAVEKFLAAIGKGDRGRAIQISTASEFFVVRVLGYALTHNGKALESAISYAQEQELKRFRRGIPILDTVITLTPLLGLLGTVTGMMGSFSLIGGELSAPGAITGGIAEALIATAFGLGIAITALLPFNMLNNRVEKAKLEIESAVAQLELVMHPPAKRNGKVVQFRMRVPISFPKG